MRYVRFLGRPLRSMGLITSEGRVYLCVHTEKGCGEIFAKKGEKNKITEPATVVCCLSPFVQNLFICTNTKMGQHSALHRSPPGLHFANQFAFRPIRSTLPEISVSPGNVLFCGYTSGSASRAFYAAVFVPVTASRMRRPPLSWLKRWTINCSTESNMSLYTACVSGVTTTSCHVDRTL